jgi:hypothetical protein
VSRADRFPAGVDREITQRNGEGWRKTRIAGDLAVGGQNVFAGADQIRSEVRGYFRSGQHSTHGVKSFVFRDF